MKAAPEAQRRLLDLQGIDTSLAQLAHRRKTLPEIAEIAAVARELSALEDERVRAQVAVDDLDRDIARFEKDIEQVRVRKDRDQVRLDSGSGPVRELEALQHELATLNRRQSELEDAELELMEQKETAQADPRRGDRPARRGPYPPGRRRGPPRPGPGRHRQGGGVQDRSRVSRSRPTFPPTCSASTTRSAPIPAAWARPWSGRAAAAAAGSSCTAPTSPG